MGIVNDYSTDLKFAFWNQKINDNFTGTVWTIAKDDGAGGFTTQDISFDGNHLDNSAIETFAGEDEIRLNRWYRQDESGGANNYLEQATWANMPLIAYDETFERYHIDIVNGRVNYLDIVDTGDNAPQTSFIHMHTHETTTGSSTTQKIFSGQNTQVRFNLELVYSGGGTLPLSLRSLGTTSNSDTVEIPSPDEWAYYTSHIFKGTGDTGNETVSKFKKNGTQIGSDFYMEGATANGLRIGSDSSRPGVKIEGVIVYYAYLSDATINNIESDIDSLISGVSLKTIITDIETGNPVPNAIVKFFEMDAFAADGMDETTAFQNVSFLPGVFKTDANGEVEFTGSIDDTKVQGAIALDNEYDAQWKFTGWFNFGTSNIDKTAPA